MFGLSKNKHKLLNPTPIEDVGITSTVVGKNITDKQFIEMELIRWKTNQSGQREEMLVGERYYNGQHDILKRKRTVIGKDGKLSEVDNLPNNKIVDNQYRKMVDQKNNFFLGNPITFHSENEQYT